MTAQIIDGKAVASAVKVEVASGVRALRRSPGLATVLVGDDPASRVYVGGKRRDAEEVGMVSIHHQLPADTSQEKLLELIASLNDDDKVDGILVQLPLPNGLDPHVVFDVPMQFYMLNVYDQLYQYEGNPPQLKPWLASSHQVSPDGLVWTITLRDAKFHDGSPITAEDVVYSFRRLLAIKRGPSAAFGTMTSSPV